MRRILLVLSALALLASCSSNNTQQSQAQGNELASANTQVAKEGNDESSDQSMTSTTHESGEQVSAMSAGGLRIAWVNMDSVLQSYDYYFELEREMKDLGAKAEKELTNRGNALQKRVMDFQDKMQKGLMTRTEGQQMQEELQVEQNQFLQLQEQKRQELAEEEQVRLRKVQNAITDFIERYNKHKGYNYILSMGVLYGDPALSITSEVIQGLNAEYAAKKQEASKQ